MSSNPRLRNPNKRVQERNDALVALLDPSSVAILHQLGKRGAQSLGQIAPELNSSAAKLAPIIAVLERTGLVCRSGEMLTLTEQARKRIDYGSVSLDFLEGSTLTGDPTLPFALRNTYLVKKRIGKGATSFTFCAEQSGVHSDRTLKVFLPGTANNAELDAALKRAAKIRRDAALPLIIDAGEVRLQFPEGGWEAVPCVVLEYVNGGARTFSEFLDAHENLDRIILERFILRVGGALAAIEEAGLVHGDLHDGNILVVSGATPAIAQEFWVIDFIGVPSAESPQLEIPSDIDNFRDHLLRAAVIICDRYPGYSASLLLGERVLRVLNSLRADAYPTFRSMLQDFNLPATSIPKDYFSSPAPDPFEWLRVEWIPSPEWLYKLFEPVTSRFETISRFGNTWVSGPRGCGKSHYLRVLAFNPQVILQSAEDKELSDKLTQLKYDYRRAFGVLFKCRLGEFKGFAPEAIGQKDFDPATQGFLKHVLVLKIWNKTLQTIKEGLESVDASTRRPVLEMPQGFRELTQFLDERLGAIAIIDDLSPLNVFLQCISVCTAKENSAVAAWPDPARRPKARLLNEDDLNGFFAMLRHVFPDLGQTRFYILVDDASFGNIHYEMQKVMNSLVRGTQENHCFKITCDKFSYTMDTTDGRPIAPGQEATYVDLGEVSTKSQREEPINLSEYFEKVTNLRLKAAGYKEPIQKLLGKSQDARTFLAALSLPGARRRKKGEAIGRRPPRPRAYYAGWNIIWSLSHGSVRTLLELLEHVFKENHVTQETADIPLRGQDAAVRKYSERRFRALAMLPGILNRQPLGQRTQAVISAIGEMSRQYLEHYDTGELGRWYETISVERLDRSAIRPDAEDVLLALINDSLLMDEGITFSRAQFGLTQRYDLNKIFAPAFQTTYRVRNHIYLSAAKFEELLLSPDVFVGRHRQKLRQLAEDKTSQRQHRLFELGND